MLTNPHVPYDLCVGVGAPIMSIRHSVLNVKVLVDSRGLLRDCKNRWIVCSSRDK